MKKTVASLLLAAICSVSLIACSPETSDVKSGELSEPPTLTVSCGEEQIEALVGTHSWMHRDETGVGTGIEADSAHPLESKESLPCLTVGYSYKSSVNPLEAHLKFSMTPNAVEIR